MNEKRSDGVAGWVDPDDPPELTGAFFDRAEIRQDDRVVRPSTGRPRSAETKASISLRLDRDILEKWRETGDGWQTRMNEALRRALEPPQVAMERAMQQARDAARQQHNSQLADLRQKLHDLAAAIS